MLVGRALVAVVGGAGSILMFAAGVGPEGARSNLSEWAKFIGAEKAADTLAAAGWDTAGFAIGAAMLGAAIVVWILRRRRATKTPPAPVSKIEISIPAPPYHLKNVVNGSTRIRQESFLDIENISDEGISNCSLRVDALIPAETPTKDWMSYMDGILALDLLVRDKEVFSLRGREKEKIVFVIYNNLTMEIRGAAASPHMMMRANSIGMTTPTILRLKAYCDSAPPSVFFFRASISASKNLVVERVHP